MNRRCTTCEDRMEAVAYLGRAQKAEAEFVAYRAMFCPGDCPDRYYVDALTGWTCKEWVCRLASLRTKVGVVVLKCQECYLKEGKCHS